MPGSVWVELPVPETVARDLSVPHGEPTTRLHITVVYLGQMCLFTESELDRIRNAVERVAGQTTRIQATTSTVGQFEPISGPVPFYRSVEDETPFANLHVRMLWELAREGIVVRKDYSTYKPHITIRYGAGPKIEDVYRSFQMTVLRLCLGREGHEFPLL